MAQAVRGAVQADEYASSSEIIREALRDWRHKRALQEQDLGELRAQRLDRQNGLQIRRGEFIQAQHLPVVLFRTGPFTARQGDRQKQGARVSR